MLNRIRTIVIKEFIQFLRDKRMRFTLLVPPVMQLIVFGYAANFDLRHISAAVIDYDQSVESRELLSRFDSTAYFDIKHRVRTMPELKELIDRSRVILGIVIPSGYANDVRRGKPTSIQVLLDGTDSNSAMVIIGYLNRILGAYNHALSAKLVAGYGEVTLEPRTWYNPNLESRVFFVPGVIALVVFIVTMILTAMAIVKEYEIGTIEQILVTPIRPLEFILGKLCPFAVVGIVDVFLICIAGCLLFKVYMVGNPLVLFLGAVTFLLSSLGFGLFLSTISRTQQQALMTSFFFINPAVLLSGFGFPIENMPEWVQYLTYLNPLRYFVVIIREVYLKGVGLEILWPQLVAMAVIGISAITVSALRFKQKLE